MAPETCPKSGPLMPLGVWLALLVFVVGIGSALYLWRYEAQTSVSVLVPMRDLSAYHQIQASDLARQVYSARDLTPVTLREPGQIVGRYTLGTVSQGHPLSDGQLGPIVDTALISGTVPIGIPATPAMVLGGNLEAGDIVDIILVPGATNVSPIPTLFENVLVLDVRPVPASQATDSRPSDHLFVVVIALPLDRRMEFATESAGATLVITRRFQRRRGPVTTDSASELHDEPGQRSVVQ